MFYTVIDCGFPPANTQGIQVASSNGSTVWSSTLYECIPGFGAMEGTPNIQCTLDGRWTDLPVCFGKY